MRGHELDEELYGKRFPRRRPRKRRRPRPKVVQAQGAKRVRSDGKRYGICAYRAPPPDPSRPEGPGNRAPKCMCRTSPNSDFCPVHISLERPKDGHPWCEAMGEIPGPPDDPAKAEWWRCLRRSAAKTTSLPFLLCPYHRAQFEAGRPFKRTMEIGLRRLSVPALERRAARRKARREAFAKFGNRLRRAKANNGGVLPRKARARALADLKKELALLADGGKGGSE